MNNYNTKLNSRGYYCKICKGSHASMTTLRQCYQDYYNARGLSVPHTPLAEIGNSMTVDPPLGWNSSSDIPTGNYLVTAIFAGVPKAVHIRVGVTRSGKWNDVYIVSLFDNKTNSLVAVRSPNDRSTIIAKLKGGNWRKALCDYGRTFSQCPICENPLLLDEMKTGCHRATECYTKVY